MMPAMKNGRLPASTPAGGIGWQVRPFAKIINNLSKTMQVMAGLIGQIGGVQALLPAPLLHRPVDIGKAEVRYLYELSLQISEHTKIAMKISQHGSPKTNQKTTLLLKLPTSSNAPLTAIDRPTSPSKRSKSPVYKR